MSTKRVTILSFLLALLAPLAASAHEVYVLSPEQITYALGIAPFNMVQVALDNLHQFIFWGFIVFVVISTVFCISIFRRVEQFIDPIFNHGKRYAHTICRITVGLGLLAGAYYQATYGPELPLAAVYGVLTPLITAVIVTIGILMLLGIWVRPAAFAALCLFGVAVYFRGAYMLTYTNYFGEFLVLLLLGAHHARTPSSRASKVTLAWHRIGRAVSPYSFAIIRICFGMSLLYAALYAKILHNNLALMVASLPLAGHQYAVAYYLGFEPHFLVLGAALVELIISAFFIFGIEIRWTSLFLEFWLSLSLVFFGESVWPHLILIGIPIALFLHGYDRWSLEGRFFKSGRLEPVL